MPAHKNLEIQYNAKTYEKWIIHYSVPTVTKLTPAELAL